MLACLTFNYAPVQVNESIALILMKIEKHRKYHFFNRVQRKPGPIKVDKVALLYGLFSNHPKQ